MPIEERIAPREIRSLLVGISSAFGALLFVAIVLAMYFGGEAPTVEAASANDIEPAQEAVDSQHRPPWAPESEGGSGSSDLDAGSSAPPTPTTAATTQPSAPGESRAAPPPTQPAATNNSGPTVGIRIGVFSVQANAERAADQLRAAGYDPLVVLTQMSGRVVRYVYAGVYHTETEARAALRRVETQGFDTVIERVIGTPPPS